MRRSPLALPGSSHSFVRGVCAGCNQPLLPAGPSRCYPANLSSDAWSHTTAVPQDAFACFFSCVIGLPLKEMGRLPALFPRTRLFAAVVFGVADISLCSSLRLCSPSRSFPPLLKLRQGGQGFYVRAERASLPLHAPDMLTARIQAIDGTETFTPLDSQCYRLFFIQITYGSQISYRTMRGAENCMQNGRTCT
jgi:hypothetical protein